MRHTTITIYVFLIVINTISTECCDNCCCCCCNNNNNINLKGGKGNGSGSFDFNNTNFNAKRIDMIMKIKNEEKYNELEKKTVENFQKNFTETLKSEEEINKYAEGVSNNTSGLRNIGNTCYLNAALQMLIHTKEFVEEIIKRGIEITNDIKTNHAEYKNEYIEIVAFANLLKEIMEKGDIANGIQDLVAFFISCQSKAMTPGNYRDIFLPGIQNDASDFLSFFLGDIDEKEDIDKKGLIDVKKIFSYKIISEVTCSKCKKNGCREDKDIICNFPIKKDKNDNEPKNIQDIINKESSNEEEIKDYNCEKCKKRNKAIKKITLKDNGAKYIIIALKRFIFDKNTLKLDKIYNKVDVTEQITFDSKNYKLKSVIIHSGSSDGGHYTNYTRNGDTWYFYDDGSFTKKGEFNTIKDAIKDGYIFQYEKIS